METALMLKRCLGSIEEIDEQKCGCVSFVIDLGFHFERYTLPCCEYHKTEPIIIEKETILNNNI